MSEMRIKRLVLKLLAVLIGLTTLIVFMTLATIVTVRLPFIYDKFMDTSRMISGRSKSGAGQPILLSAYMNSGSSYMGLVLGSRADAFYFYEPLHRLSVWDYFVNNETMCSSVRQSCRASRHSRSKAEEALMNIFNCQMNKLQDFIVPGVTAEPTFVGESWSSYRMCMKRYLSVDTCLGILEGVCRHANHVVTKVLRLTVGGTEELLQNNPRLNVIHLFRDPRAVINSRLETSGYPFLRHDGKIARAIINNARALCDKMAVDIADGYELMSKYPDRFRFIHYEDIYNNPASLKKLYSFLRIFTNMRSFQTKFSRQGRKDVDASRSRDNAYWWTHHMKSEYINLVNSVCSNVIWQLGYPEVKTANDLVLFNTSSAARALEFLL